MALGLTLGSVTRQRKLLVAVACLFALLLVFKPLAGTFLQPKIHNRIHDDTPARGIDHGSRKVAQVIDYLNRGKPVIPNARAMQGGQYQNIGQRLSNSKPIVDTVEVNGEMASHDHFDAEKVHNLFGACRTDGDLLLLDCYVNAYEELCKLFRLFGTVFGFVSSDVEEKIGILRDYRKSENGEHYKTIQSMLSYEVSTNIIKKRKNDSGARTLLRLHRALEFIVAFLIKLKETDNKAKFSSVVTKAYDDTLAKFHPWLIKKAVHVAMYMLPSRADMLKKMGITDDEKDMTTLMSLVKELEAIYSITQDLYAKDKLLDLP